MNGSQILAEALERQGVDMFFFIMGAPMLMVEAEALKRGLRGIDVRHEQAAAMMAHAYARLRLRPGVCMAASGPARDQPGHRGRARLGRRRPDHRARRQRAGRHLGPRRVPGHGPAGDDGALHQVGGARASRRSACRSS